MKAELFFADFDAIQNEITSLANLPQKEALEEIIIHYVPFGILNKESLEEVITRYIPFDTSNVKVIKEFHLPSYIFSIVFDALFSRRFFFSYFYPVEDLTNLEVKFSIHPLHIRKKILVAYSATTNSPVIRIEKLKENIKIVLSKKNEDFSLRCLRREKEFHMKGVDAEVTFPFDLEEFIDELKTLYDNDFRLLLVFINKLSGFDTEITVSLTDEEKFLLYKNTIEAFQKVPFDNLLKLWPVSYIRLFFNLLYVSSHMGLSYRNEGELIFMQLTHSSFKWVWRYLDVEKEFRRLLTSDINRGFKRRIYNWLVSKRFDLESIKFTPW